VVQKLANIIETCLLPSIIILALIFLDFLRLSVIILLIYNNPQQLYTEDLDMLWIKKFANVNAMMVGLVFLLFVNVFANSGYAKINPENVVGAWLFEEGSGNIAKDSSGKGNNGEIKGSPKWINGKFGRAMEFNGKVVLYINGEIDKKASLTGDMMVNDKDLWIGASEFWTPRFFNGIMDEASLFNVPLALNDIKSLMMNGLGSLLAVQPAGKLTNTWAKIKR